MAGPIIPRNAEDPTGQDRRERAAMAEFSRRIKAIGRQYKALVARIPFEAITVNATYYEFRLDPAMLAGLFAEVGLYVDALLLEGGESRLWFSQEYIVPAYQQGTAQTMTNLGAQSITYAASRQQLTDLIASAPYQKRIGLLRAREFELMRGLSDAVKSQMSFVLSNGLAQGIGPREIARQLTLQTGIDERRAHRIARTEVTNALRQARLDEAQQATLDLGIQTRQMHLSALSPTTRPSHRARHGLLYTVSESREWWATSPNSINCKCSTTEILVDDKGEPLNPAAVAKVRARA